jgi:hypothetical protein
MSDPSSKDTHWGNANWRGIDDGIAKHRGRLRSVFCLVALPSVLRIRSLFRNPNAGSRRDGLQELQIANAN